MWRFKPFTHKEQTGLEGRTLDVGNLKIHVRKAIAEGGFSCVYLAQDATNGAKHYAVKHIICNDEEFLELVVKEISAMKSLKGHPNVVTLHAHTFFDMGRTKEALLVMEFCEKSLVNVLENRGVGYFEEKQILAIFRDVCNAVFAMHCQTPPIAHRDLKAENLLLGPDGLWKLCDFGSISTNHKRFEKPEEMGIEEDNIRKHTTPAYRAPEMWDMFRRELISEKVDIWALGCLLFRIAYFKSAFDGESKLQILNGNYRIPDLPKYSSAITDLIRDMLQSSPDARPDITQLWFRVNGLLPDELQKSLPDRPLEMPHSGPVEATPKSASKGSPTPRRSPPPPPQAAVAEPSRRSSAPPPPQQVAAPMGAFWTTQHVKDSFVTDEEPTIHKNSTYHSERITASQRKNPPSKESDVNLFREIPEKKDAAYNAFIGEFSGDYSKGLGKKEELLEGEIEKLKEELMKTNIEKADITSKYEKLSAICRSQRQELQDLKQALSSRTPSPNKTPIHTPNEKIEGTVYDLQQGTYGKSTPSPDPKQWQPFAEDTNKSKSALTNETPKSVRTRSNNGSQNSNAWGFGSDNFTAFPSSDSGASVVPMSEPKKKVESKPSGSQPSGWAGF
jgi:AP2-associated kinase